MYLTLPDISEFWSVVPRPVIDNNLGFSREATRVIVQTPILLAMGALDRDGAVTGYVFESKGFLFLAH